MVVNSGAFQRLHAPYLNLDTKKAPTFGRGLLVSIVLTAAEAGAAVVAEVAGSVSYGD